MTKSRLFWAAGTILACGVGLWLNYTTQNHLYGIAVAVLIYAGLNLVYYRSGK
jgi:hypothetical protein